MPRSEGAAPAARHFTATGYVVHEGCVALHWHPKVKAWLPPGGHIDANEDPVQAVLREVEEETGLAAEVVQTGPRLDLEYPKRVAPPFTIMIEDIHDPVDGYHQHIDMIYFCRPAGAPGALSEGWRWVARDTLREGLPIRKRDGSEAPPPEDVRALAERAFALIEGDARRAAGRSAGLGGSPLDVEGVDLDVTTDEIIAMVREGRGRYG